MGSSSSTVLVTGGAGYIGSHTVYSLLGAGWKVVVLDDLSTGHQELIPGNVVFVKGKVEDRGLVVKIVEEHGIDTVLHFAGSVIVPESIKDPIGYYSNNTGNSAVLLGACVESGVKNFIFSSTAAVYGIADEMPVTEKTPTSPITPYGWSKLMVETMLGDTASAHGLGFVVMRYFNVAGSDSEGRTGQCSPMTTHLIRAACKVALGQLEFLEIYGDDYNTPDGTCVRDYIHVSDLADAHVLALSHLQDGGDDLILNCGYGHGYSVKEVVSALEKICGTSLPVRFVGRRQGDLAEMIADASQLHNILGWSPRFDRLDSIIGTMLNWEKSRQI